MSKQGKLAHSLSPADKISLYFLSITIRRGFFWQKEEDLLPLFHKMLEGLGLALYSFANLRNQQRYTKQYIYLFIIDPEGPMIRLI